MERDFESKYGNQTFQKKNTSFHYTQYQNSGHFKNNKSAITHSDFVSEAIQDLLKTNRIIEVNGLPHVVNPVSVTVQNSG